MKNLLPLFILSIIILSFVGCIYPGGGAKEANNQNEPAYDGRLVRYIGDYDGRPSTYRAKQEKMNRSQEEAVDQGDRYSRNRSDYGGGGTYTDDRETNVSRYERDRSDYYEGRSSTQVYDDSRTSTDMKEDDCQKTKRKKEKKEKNKTKTKTERRTNNSGYGSYDEYKAARKARKSNNKSSRDRGRDYSSNDSYYEQNDRSNDYYADSGRSNSNRYADSGRSNSERYADSGRSESDRSYSYGGGGYTYQDSRDEDDRKERGRTERFEYDDRMESLDKKMDKTRTEGERKLSRRATMLADRYCSCDRKRKENKIIKCQDAILDEVYRISDGIKDNSFRGTFNGMFKRAVSDC